MTPATIVDTDGDGVRRCRGQLPDVANPDQADADGDGVGDACDDEEGEEEEACAREGHPVLTAYAEEFGVPYEELAAYRCQHLGIGEIGRALLMAEAAGVTYQEILEKRLSGESWGAIKKEYGISGKELAPGRIISGRHGEEEEEAAEAGKEKKEKKEKKEPGRSRTRPGSR